MMIPFATLTQWILGFILILASLGVVLLKKPVHASLSFLLALLTLATLYLQLSAEFIAAIQILVYAGAILVIFMFVIILFQDAHERIEDTAAKSSKWLRGLAAAGMIAAFILLGSSIFGLLSSQKPLSPEFGTVQSIGKTLYIDFFFPFEAIVVVFLVAIVGALYIGKKGSIVQSEDENK